MGLDENFPTSVVIQEIAFELRAVSRREKRQVEVQPQLERLPNLPTMNPLILVQKVGISRRE